MSAIKDITGERFGRLTVSHRDTSPRSGKCNNAVWVCACSCGSIKSVSSGQLRTGKTRSCGCLALENKSIRAKGNKYGERKRLNLTGERFGKLRAISSGRVGVWDCECDCGRVVTVRVAHLRNGHTQSCGCLLSETIRKTQTVDLTGNKYGRLVVRALVHREAGVHWRCDCDCGNSSVVGASNLTRGNTLSCGCLKRENAAKNKGVYSITRARRKDFSGYLYLYLMLVPFKGEEYPKIGLSVNPERRARNLRARLIYSDKMEANEAVIREQLLHQKFSERRAFKKRSKNMFEGYTECFTPGALGIFLKALLDQPIACYRNC